MSNLINQIAEAIEAEIHEAWTESDADFIRGMEYAVSIVKASDMRTDSDTISRADAMGAVQDHFNADGFKGYDDGQKMMDRIKALPSADAMQGWIPCSERLPSESGDYLCTIPLDADETYTEVLTFHKGRFYEDDDEWGATYHDDVLAWMPLPKPYKGGDDE